MVVEPIEGSTMLESLALWRLGDLKDDKATTGKSMTDSSLDLRFRCNVLMRKRNVWL
jgi:hypothetical protein